MKYYRALKTRGFTLIELLVVISIIAIASTLALSVFPRSNNVKRGGTIIQAVFMNAGQMAVSERVVFFVAFDKQKSLLSIYRNAEEDDPEGEEKFDKEKDQVVGEQVQLPKGVKFSETTPLLQLAEPYVGFRPNGLMFLPQGITDKSFNPPQEADIVLEQTNRKGKMYLDFTIVSGRVRRIDYRED